MKNCIIHRLKTKSYGEVLEMQKSLFEENIQLKRSQKQTINHLLVVEHPHVYTFGKHAKSNHLLASPEYLESMGAEIHYIERGGDITYHGPGQLVVYPIFDLESLNIGIKSYVEKIEAVIIDVLDQYDIKAGAISDRIGVWIGIGTPNERKIAAIGIKSSRYITMHGLALNINTDLNMFNHIVPCGIPDKAVCSMESELNEKIDLFEVQERTIDSFVSIFELRV
jgi:lipoyl(octanoyl) transferase